MQLLQTEFTHDGRTLRQLKRSARAGIYQLIGEQGLLYGFEVIKITVRKEAEKFGKIFPASEVYPSDSRFGTRAWSFGRRYMKEAFAKFDTLSAAEEETIDAPKFQDAAVVLEQAAVCC